MPHESDQRAEEECQGAEASSGREAAETRGKAARRAPDNGSREARRAPDNGNRELLFAKRHVVLLRVQAASVSALRLREVRNGNSLSFDRALFLCAAGVCMSPEKENAAALMQGPAAQEDSSRRAGPIIGPEILAAAKQCCQLQPGERFEILYFASAPNAKRSPRSKTFTDDAEALVWAKEGDGYNTYIGLNPLARAPMSRRRPADADVNKIRILLIDLDPGDTSKEARATAAEMADEIREFIKKRLGVQPPLICSGRGRQIWLAHEATVPGDTLRKSLLHALAAKFDRPGAKVDPVTANASRLGRLPGTVNTKTGERATILDSGDGGVASLEAIKALVQEITPSEKADEDGSAEFLVRRPDGSTWRVGRPNSQGRYVVALLATDGAIIAEDRVDPASSASRRRFAKSIVEELGEGEIADFDRELRELLSRSDLPPEIVNARKTASDILLKLVNESDAQLWRDDLGDPFITADVDGVAMNWRLKSREARAWFSRLYYEATEKALAQSALTDSLGFLTSVALFNGDKREAAVRLAVAGDHETIWLDLGRPDGQTARVTGDGWQLVPSGGEHRFIRPSGLLSLPLPLPQSPTDTASTISALWELVHVEVEDRSLLLGWLLAALAPRGPFLHLALSGPAGSAKSTTSRVLRSLIDPNAMPLRSSPRDEDALLIAAGAGRLIVLDNLTRVPVWLSDSLCRLSTGGGLSKRKLYTDDEEIIMSASRPCILNGIGAPVAAPDLLDRTLSLQLKPIPEAARRRDSDLDAALAEIQPAMLGVLLNAAALALKRRGEIKFDSLPRMAEAATWIEAGAPALGLGAGEFIERMRSQRSDALIGAIDATPFGMALVSLLDEKGEWRGTASALLDTLNHRLDSKRTPRQWPETARALSSAVDRLTPALQARGHRIDRKREGQNRERILIISSPESRGQE